MSKQIGATIAVFGMAIIGSRRAENLATTSGMQKLCESGSASLDYSALYKQFEN